MQAVNGIEADDADRLRVLVQHGEDDLGGIVGESGKPALVLVNRYQVIEVHGGAYAVLVADLAYACLLTGTTMNNGLEYD